MENGHLQRAQLLLEQRRFDLAQVELRRLLAEDPDHGPALALLALCRLNLGDVLQARQLAEQAIGAAADQAFTYYVMSVIQAERVRLADAVRQVKRAIELDPADADYHGFLAAIYVALNRPEEAIDAARIGLQYDPGHVRCLNLIARERTKTGHHNEAESNLRTALEINPQNAETLTLLGELQLRQGDTEDARKSFDHALALQPGNSDAQSGLSEARRASNAIYRRLLPLLLKGDTLTRAEPLRSRIIFLTFIWVLWAVTARMPSGKPIGIVISTIGTVILTIFILAKPLMNLQFCRRPLQWYALTWQERFMSAGLIISAIWCGMCVWIGINGHINNPLFVLALASIIPMVPVAAIGTHHDRDIKRQLWPFAIVSIALWVAPAIGYAIELIQSTEVMGIFAVAAFLAGIPKMSSLMEKEEGSDE